MSRTAVLGVFAATALLAVIVRRLVNAAIKKSAMARRALAVGATKSFEDIPEIPGKVPIFGTIYSEDADYLKKNMVTEAGMRLDKMWSHLQAKYVDPKGANMLRLTMGLITSKHKSAVQLFDPEDVRTIFRNEGDTPDRGEGLLSLKLLREQVIPNWNDGSLVTEDGEEWMKTRSAVEKELASPQSALAYLDQINKVAAEFVDFMRRDRDRDTKVNRGDIMHSLKLFSMEAITQITLGRRLGGLDTYVDPPVDEVIRSLSSCADGQDKLAMYPLWKIFSFCPRVDPNFRRIEDGSKFGWKFVHRLVCEATKRFSGRENSEYESNEAIPLIDKLMRKLGADSNVPFVTALDIVSSSNENVATAATWLLYNLAKNPDKQEKLREEALALGEKVTEKDIGQGMHYAKAFMKESFRLTPTIAGASRVLPHDVNIRDYHIPAGTYVFWIPDRLGQDPKSFPEAEVFRPERWLEKDKGQIHPYAVLPFSHGKRNCAGRRIAEMELLVLLVKLVQNFRLEWAAPDYNTVEPIFKFTNRPNRDLVIKFTDI